MTTVTLTIEIEGDLTEVSNQIGREANRLAKAFEFCTAEKNAEQGLEEGPIWKLIRDLRRVEAALDTYTEETV